MAHFTDDPTIPTQDNRPAPGSPERGAVAFVAEASLVESFEVIDKDGNKNDARGFVEACALANRWHIEHPEQAPYRVRHIRTFTPATA